MISVRETLQVYIVDFVREGDSCGGAPSRKQSHSDEPSDLRAHRESSLLRIESPRFCGIFRITGILQSRMIVGDGKQEMRSQCSQHGAASMAPMSFMTAQLCVDKQPVCLIQSPSRTERSRGIHERPLYQSLCGDHEPHFTQAV